MKKLFLSFAVATVALTVMASCGGSDTTAQAEENDGEAVEAAAKAAPAAAADEKPYKGNVNKLWTTDENVDLLDVCSVTLPAFHKTTYVDERVVRAELYTPWEGDLETAPMQNNIGNFTVQVYKLGKAETWVKNAKESDERGTYKGEKVLREVPAITLAGKEFKGYARGGDNVTYLRDLDGDGGGYVTISLYPRGASGKDEMAFATNDITVKALNAIKWNR